MGLIGIIIIIALILVVCDSSPPSRSKAVRSAGIAALFVGTALIEGLSSGSKRGRGRCRS